MNKIKAIPFIVLGTIVHVMLVATVFGAYISCDTRTNCVSTATRVSATVLSFPINLVSWIWERDDARISSGSFLILLLNSVLAVTIVWFFLKAIVSLGRKSISAPKK
ncbi:hypothetical protein DVJ77_14945 [Dyella tabacisoli]|uniref:Uncharacterized protein n=1 Tax=Dyella tabacisoli TaxID=2282381 RepID=A0A369UKZ1_9GAMM|nr:hypothetical protein DVJ77_14945 [Dyella tabacisoli]